MSRTRVLRVHLADCLAAQLGQPRDGSVKVVNGEEDLEKRRRIAIVDADAESTCACLTQPRVFFHAPAEQRAVEGPPLVGVLDAQLDVRGHAVLDGVSENSVMG